MNLTTLQEMMPRLPAPPTLPQPPPPRMAPADVELVPRRVDPRAYKAARSAANRRVIFIGHYLVFASTCALVWLVAGRHVAFIVALGWGIGLVCHGWFGVFGPMLRRRWMAVELLRGNAHATEERRELEGRHARSLEELSASIAHEIRNPVTAAKSLVAQMGEDPSSAENVEYARVALEELDRVERSISHLLRYARDEEIDMQDDVRVSEIVDSAIESFRDRIARTGVEVVCEHGESGSVRADPEKLRRVVINLVGNALDALETREPLDAGVANAPCIDVKDGLNLAGTEVWLRVKDNGPGIPADRIASIFTPFYTSKAGGTGLGLAISKKVVEAHGGSLEVRSESGKAHGGAEFTVTLPKRAPG